MKKAWIAGVSLALVAAWIPEALAQAQASPTLAWNRIALEAVERARPTQHQAMRLLAYVSLAQVAALSEGADPTAARDAVAAASARIIAELLPAQAAFAQERYRQMSARIDDDASPVAQQVLAQARADGFTQAWTGAAPQSASTWRSLANPAAPPAYPAVGGMRTFLVESGSSLRSVPPPAQDSARFLADLAEVRQHVVSPTAESTRMAKFYDMSTGTMVAGFWNERAAELVRARSLNEVEGARVLATMNAAMMDAVVSCHDAKYTYWVPRPSQADPAIKALIGVPNHPSYPSNHSCVSTAAALTLAHFFPQERTRLETMAAEAGLSRIYGGLHYRFDVEAGEEIGRRVAAAAAARHAEMLARWARTLVSAN